MTPLEADRYAVCVALMGICMPHRATKRVSVGLMRKLAKAAHRHAAFRTKHASDTERLRFGLTLPNLFERERRLLQELLALESL